LREAPSFYYVKTNRILVALGFAEGGVTSDGRFSQKNKEVGANKIKNWIQFKFSFLF
jgi:hypothetical protein